MIRKQRSKRDSPDNLRQEEIGKSREAISPSLSLRDEQVTAS
jgi:hypothetical protein